MLCVYLRVLILLFPFFFVITLCVFIEVFTLQFFIMSCVFIEVFTLQFFYHVLSVYRSIHFAKKIQLFVLNYVMTRFL
jgi:hypothetical protein